MTSFADRLLRAGQQARSLVCVGLDPRVDLLPDSLPGPVDRAVLSLNRAVVDATADLVTAYKLNLAFYEALGLPGLRAMELTLAHLRDAAPHALVIADAKRGDLPSTVSAYAAAFRDVWGFDAVTVNPWGGLDGVDVWLERPGFGVLVWCRSSGPGALDLQELVLPTHEPVYLRLAWEISVRSDGGDLGLVVGATAPAALAAVRRLCPSLPLLVPGIGRQGGDLAESVRRAVDRSGRLALFSSSGQVLHASSGPDYADAARGVVLDLRDVINRTLDLMGLGWGVGPRRRWARSVPDASR